jgi:hypothetical protein
MNKRILVSTAAIAALALASFGPAQAQAYRTGPGYYSDPITGAASAGAGIVGGAATFGSDIVGGAVSTGEGIVGGVLSPFAGPMNNNYNSGYGSSRAQPAGYASERCRRGRALVDGVWHPAVVCN